MYLWYAAGVTGLFASGCYMIYRSKTDDAKLIQQIEYVDLDDNLRSKLEDGKTIELAAIKGDVYAENQALRGNFSPDTSGVVSNFTTYEHGSNYNNISSSWDDVDKLIKSTDDAVPFKLVNTDNDLSIRVINANLACGLTLETIYEHFEPAKDRNIFENFSGWFYGYYILGIKTTEKILKVGTTLTGVGQIVKSSYGEIQLKPPKCCGYYLTRDNLDALKRDNFDALIKQISSDATIWRNLCIILAIGAGILAAYALYKKHQQVAEDRDRIETIARLRRGQNSTNTDQVLSIDNFNDDDNRQCVVCMIDERNTVLLECGHICVCNTCASQLDSCPLCRRSIDRIVLTYQG